MVADPVDCKVYCYFIEAYWIVKKKYWATFRICMGHYNRPPTDSSKQFQTLNIMVLFSEFVTEKRENWSNIMLNFI